MQALRRTLLDELSLLVHVLPAIPFKPGDLASLLVCRNWPNSALRLRQAGRQAGRQAKVPTDRLGRTRITTP